MSPEQNIESGNNPPILGGHMLYEKYIDDPNSDLPLFVKAFNINLLTIPSKAKGMKEDLKREYDMYDYLASTEFRNIPEEFSYENDKLKISAYQPKNGWYWEVPKSSTYATYYSEDILETIDELKTIPPIDFEHESTTNHFYNNGWLKIFQRRNATRIINKIEESMPYLHANTVIGAEKLIDVINGYDLSLANKAEVAHQKPRTMLGHFDARPSNIAWHPTGGVKLVDWSWCANTSQNSDSTMFLIDVHKTDFETRNLDGFEKHFDENHAALFMGYWLLRCIAPAPDQTVRFHQLASAATAASIIL